MTTENGQTPEKPPVTRIDPATDPVKNILDKIYDNGLKYLLSNQVSWKMKAGVIAALYSTITGGMGLYNNMSNPAENLTETTMRANAEKIMTTTNVAGQCFYEDKSRTLQVTFTENSTMAALTEIAASIATMTTYTPKAKTYALGTLPYIVSAPCDVVAPAARIDANTMGTRSRDAVNDFMKTAKASAPLNDAAARGYFSVRPQVLKPE